MNLTSNIKEKSSC